MEQILYDWICTWFLTISKVSLLNAGFYSLSTRIKFFVIACEFGTWFLTKREISLLNAGV